MLVPIESIKVKERIRKDMGDIGALADSMRRFGQISPIVISRKNILIAGGRRLEAALSLGWTEIDAVFADLSDKLAMVEYEVEENMQRRSFTTEEEEKAMKKIFRLRNPSFFRSIWNAIVKFFRRLFRLD
jgi:ParB family chromosome partitioning protein